jgi:methoxymalonate biosynthesis acyl carrier protein
MNGREHADIRQFILTRFPAAQLADDQDIFSLGYVHSLFAMELVLFIEKHFGVEIANEELDIANFRTIDAMAALVQRCAVPV